VISFRKCRALIGWQYIDIGLHHFWVAKGIYFNRTELVEKQDYECSNGEAWLGESAIRSIVTTVSL